MLRALLGPTIAKTLAFLKTRRGGHFSKFFPALGLSSKKAGTKRLRWALEPRAKKQDGMQALWPFEVARSWPELTGWRLAAPEGHSQRFFGQKLSP
jgi:hypothetical protein